MSENRFKFSLPSPSQLKNLVSVISKKEKFLLYLAILLLVGSLLAWGVNFYLSSTEKAPGLGGEYTEGVVGQPLYINPLLSKINDIDGAISSLVFSSLMTYDQNGSLTEDLAERYSVSEDGKKYEFKIKESAKWHDKTALTAKDVVFTINLIQNPGYASASLRNDWQDVKAYNDGDFKVIFELPEPNASFLNKLTFGILPRHIFEQVSKENFELTEFNLKPVGSGPFEFSNIEIDNKENIISYHLLRNPEYYGQKANLEKINFNFYVDQAAVFEAYIKKEINGFVLSEYEKIPELSQRQDTRIHRLTVPHYFTIFFNQTKSVPLADQKVRKALEKSINRDEIIEAAFQGYAQKVYSPLLSSFGDFSSSLSADNFGYNLEEAEQLLEEAGWKKGDDGIRKKDEQALEISLITTSTPEWSRTAEIVKSQWEKLGAKIEIQSLDIVEFRDNFMRPREYQSILLLVRPYFGNDPDPFFFWHSSGKKDPGQNLALFGDDEVDRILEEARKEQNLEKRKELYGQFEKKIFEQTPAVFLFSPDFVYVTNKKIKGNETASITMPFNRMLHANQWYIKTIRVRKQD